MIFRKQSLQPDRKVHPLIGLLLFLISIALLLITGPLGFLYGLGHALFTRGIRGIGEYSLKIAVSIDQLGNVMMQHLLNALWIKKGGYAFGNRDETISSALGRNHQLGTLTALGRGIDAFLDLIDPRHSLNSIDYYTEPSEAVTDMVSWVEIENGRVLFLKEKGHPFYFLPGGERKATPSDALQLALYLKHLLGIDARTDGVTFLGTYESRNEPGQPTAILRQHCYTMPFVGRLQPIPAIEGPYWFGYADRHRLREADRRILDALHEKGLIG